MIGDLPPVIPEAYALRCLPTRNGMYDYRVRDLLRRSGYRMTTSRKLGASVFSPLLYIGPKPKGTPIFSSSEAQQLVHRLAALVGESVDENFLKLLREET